jgi:hypothetical protein
MSAVFSDQVDKFIFWRSLAEKIRLLRAHAVIFVAESWIREIPKSRHLAIREMPIRDEVLKVVGVTSAGELKEMVWRIVRTDGKPALERTRDQQYKATSAPFFLVPAMKAMGVSNPLSVRSELL